jgi:hypothetical protein
MELLTISFQHHRRAGRMVCYASARTCAGPLRYIVRVLAGIKHFQANARHGKVL